MSEDKPRKRKVYTSPLRGLADAAPTWGLAPKLREAASIESSDPKRAEQLREEHWKEVELKCRDDEDKKNRVGKYDPENIPLGRCRICNGDVVERLKWKQNGEMRIGGPSNSYRVRDCFYCKTCGIVYAHTDGLLAKET